MQRLASLIETASGQCEVSLRLERGSGQGTGLHIRYVDRLRVHTLQVMRPERCPSK
jgi:hypothetical protein